MDTGSADQLQQHCQQPQSLIGEDFELVSTGSDCPSLQPTPAPLSLPPESDPNSAVYQLSLACPTASAESEFQQMAKQISQVSEKQTCLHGSLKENANGLEQFRSLLNERVSEMKKALADRDVELNAKAEHCESLLAQNNQMKVELSRLKTSEEEWKQTFEDYNKLKNQYNLLTNTKERLESEKADLQRSRDESVAAETEKLRIKLDEERSAAVKAEKNKWEEKLMNLQAEHAQVVKSLKLELTGAQKENEANLQTAQSEKEQALASEQQRCRAEIESLLTEHRSAMDAMRKEFEKKIQEQEGLANQAKQELQDHIQALEAEKNEMLDMARNLDVVSIATENYNSVHTTPGVSKVNCSDATEPRDAPASPESLPLQDHDMSSLTPTLAADATENGVANSHVSNEPNAPDQKRDLVLTSSMECQTDPMECPQVENADSLRKDSKFSNLMVQISSFAAALKTERQKTEDLDAKLMQQQVKNDELLYQLVESRRTAKTAEAAERRAGGSDEETQRLKKRLADKQAELDSVLEDFDETRHKVYELGEKVKDLENRAKHRAETDRQQSSQTGGGNTSEAEKRLAEKQAELDSLLEDFDQTRHKVYELTETVKDYQNRAEHRAQQAYRPVASQPGGGDNSGLEKRLADKQAELDSVLEDFDETRHKVYELTEKVKDLENRQLHCGPSGDEAGALRKQLGEKQVEIDSLIKDLDDTRNKVCQLQESAKDSESRLTQGDSQVEKLRQKIRDLESQAEIDRKLANNLQMEIDSLRKNTSFKDTKLKSAEDLAEQLRQENQRLSSKIDELNKKLTEAETVKIERNNLKEMCETQLEVLDQHKNLIERKAGEVTQLTETIAELSARLKQLANESDSRLVDEKRKYERLYDKLCSESVEKKKLVNELTNVKDQLAQSEQIVSQLTDQVGQANQQKTQAEQQLAQANNELQQLRQQLQHRTAELQESQKFSSEIQDFSAGLERDIEALKQQLEESSKKRDDVIKMCEQLRLRFEEDQRQLAAVNSELQRVNFEHAKLRAEYSDMERNATAWLAREHELQEKLRHAEEAIGVFKDELEVKEAANAELKERVNRLLEDLASQEPQCGRDAHVLDRHRAPRRPPGGGNY